LSSRDAAVVVQAHDLAGQIVERLHAVLPVRDFGAWR